MVARGLLLAVAVIALVLLIFWYFKIPIPLINQIYNNNIPAKLSDEDKYKILDSLGANSTNILTKQEKLNIMNSLDKKSTTEPLSENNKLKLLEELSKE